MVPNAKIVEITKPVNYSTVLFIGRFYCNKSFPTDYILLILFCVTENVLDSVLMIKPRCVITLVGTRIDFDSFTLNPHCAKICNTLRINAYASSRDEAKKRKSSMYGRTFIP